MNRINLNYDWHFCEGFDNLYIESVKLKDGHRVNIPHTVKELPLRYVDSSSYQGVYTYQKIFRLSVSDVKKTVLLTFEGVMNKCEVYLNGELLGKHEGGFTSFTFEINNLVRFDKDNLLVLKVDTRENDKVAPFGGDMEQLCFGGIYREVHIDLKSPEYFKNVLVSSIDNTGLDIQYKLRRKVVEYDVRYTLFDENGHIMLQEINHQLNNDGFDVQVEVKNPHLWDVDDPYLYTLRSELIVNKYVYDVNFTKVGIRETKFEEDGFYLNGNKIKLVGLTRNQNYPIRGFAMPKTMQKLDAYILRHDLNCNFVRTANYPNSKHFYETCDEIGLLVFADVPGYKYVGEEKWQASLVKQTKEMITEHFNHPSIVLWNSRVSNKTNNEDLYKTLYETIKEIDKYRQVAGIRGISKTKLVEDVVAYNDYSETISNPKKVYRRHAPYLISEHSGYMCPAKDADSINNKVDQALNHARVINACYENEHISGVVGNCLTDYYCHDNYGSGDNICYHGVLDMFRNGKFAANIYRSQNSEDPYLEVLSNLHAGDFKKSLFSPIYIASNVDCIKVYRGEEFVTQLEKSTEFANLPQPLFKLDNLIGDLLAKKEGINDADTKSLVAILRKAYEKGLANLKSSDSNKLKALLKSNDLTIDAVDEFFDKYFANRSSNIASYYKFVGVKNGAEVIEQKVGFSNKTGYIVNISQASFNEEETYDVMKVDVRRVNEFGNTLDYANDVINVATKGAIGVIGSSSKALEGGLASFYIESKGLNGQASIIISSNGYLIKQIETNVSRDERNFS